MPLLLAKFDVVDVDDNYLRCASDYIPIPMIYVSVLVTGTSSLLLVGEDIVKLQKSICSVMYLC